MALIQLLLKLLPFAIFVIWYARYRWKRHRLYELATKFDGPTTGLPFLGNVRVWQGLRSFKYLLEMMQSFPSPFRIWVGPYLFIIICNPDDFEIVAKHQKALNKGHVLYSHVQPILGEGLITAPVNKWRVNRRIIAPTFSQKNLEGFFNVFRQNSDHMLEKIKTRERNGIFDVFPYLAEYATSTIIRTSLGIDMNSTTFNPRLLLTAGVRLLELMTIKLTSVWYLFDGLYYFTRLRSEANKCIKTLSTLIDSIIADWRFRHREDLDDEQPKSIKHFLDYLLGLSKDGIYFTDKQIRNEVTTLLATGSDTTSSTVGFVLMVLGIYPEMQKKVYDEIINVVGKEKPIEYEDLDKLEYMERITKEALRMFPVGIVIARESEDEIQLKTKTIPAGATIILSILGIHRNPEIWPNPNKFDPDRFLPEEIAKRHPFSWVPFSDGPRNCIGIRYAWMSMKVILAAVIRKYYITTPYKSIDDIPLKFALTLNVENGYKIEINSRNGVQY